MRWYAQASISIVYTNENRFSHHYLSHWNWMIGMCVSIRVLRSHCVHGPKSLHKSRTNLIIAATTAIRSRFFFFHRTNFFLLYFICAKQQSTVLFFFQMHVDNAKEQCVSINIVIYHLLNAFKWQNSRKTVLFFSWFANWKCNASSWFRFSLSFCVILARFSMCNTQNWKLHSWNFSQTPHQHAITKVWVYEHTTEHWWMK